MNQEIEPASGSNSPKYLISNQCPSRDFSLEDVISNKVKVDKFKSYFFYSSTKLAVSQTRKFISANKIIVFKKKNTTRTEIAPATKIQQVSPKGLTI